MLALLLAFCLTYNTIVIALWWISISGNRAIGYWEEWKVLIDFNAFAEPIVEGVMFHASIFASIVLVILIFKKIIKNK